MARLNMLPRSGSNVRFPDSGYISDHEPRYEPKRTISNLPDALLRCKKDRASSANCHNADDPPNNEPSSPAEFPEATSRTSSSAKVDAAEATGMQDRITSEHCDSDSEDGLALEHHIPFTASKDFPIVPLPSTLAKAGYNAAAKEVERSSSKGSAKVNAGTAVLRTKSDGDQGGAANKPVSVGVIVPSKRARYSFADALDNAEERIEAEKEDEDEDEDEYESEADYV